MNNNNSIIGFNLFHLYFWHAMAHAHHLSMLPRTKKNQSQNVNLVMSSWPSNELKLSGIYWSGRECCGDRKQNYCETSRQRENASQGEWDALPVDGDWKTDQLKTQIRQPSTVLRDGRLNSNIPGMRRSSLSCAWRMVHGTWRVNRRPCQTAIQIGAKVEAESDPVTQSKHCWCF